MKHAGRVFKWVLGSLAVLAAAGGLVVLAFFRAFYPSPPEARYPPAADPVTAQHQDFEYLGHYLHLNRSYAPEARQQAAALLEQHRHRADALTPAQFDLAVARIVALADNGHSHVYPGPLARRHQRLPCRLYYFADGYHVIRARPACAGLLGAKLLEIEGRPIGEVADRLFEYVGGPRNHYDQFDSVFYLESPPLLQAAGLANATDRLRLRVTMPGGSERDVEVLADPANPDGPRVFGNEYLSPLPVENEEPDWQPLLPRGTTLPLFLTAFDDPFRSLHWPESATYYVQFRGNDDEAGHSIGEFIAEVRRQILSSRPKHIVLDLRFNQGGNLTKTTSLMKELAHLTESIERVSILTSAWTFSAGNTSLALVKEHGGDKVTVIGEPVGDRLRLWAEGGTLELPNSKLRMGFATGLHDYSRSCRGEPGCFWVMYFFPMSIDTLEPDVRVSYSFDDYVNLRDPVLERALIPARKKRK